MAPKKTSTHLSKSDFIRQQPATVSAIEIVAMAKAEGIVLSRNLVYMVRGAAAPKGSASRRSRKRATRKEAPTATKGVASKPSAARAVAPSKADFVRARAHLSPREIAEDAKAAGRKLDANYVYNVRTFDQTAATHGAIISADTRVEALLKAAAAELGLGRAIEILEEERARVRAVLGE
jgi:hypothetical protein